MIDVAPQALRVLHLSRAVELFVIPAAAAAVQPSLWCNFKRIRYFIAVVRDENHKSFAFATRRAALKAESILNHPVAPVN